MWSGSDLVLLLSPFVTAPINAAFTQPQDTTTLQNAFSRSTRNGNTGGQLDVMCGPLLNYQGMIEEESGLYWHGSVLIVVAPNERHPLLQLRALGPITQSSNAQANGGLFSKLSKGSSVEGLKLYSDPDKTFWRFTLKLPLSGVETRWQYTIPDIRFSSGVSISPSREFVVPSAIQSMRLMFHSCNGFSVGTDEEFWSGQDAINATRVFADSWLTHAARSCAVEQRT